MSKNRIKRDFLHLNNSTKKMVIISGAIILICIIILFYFTLNSSDNYNNIKKDRSKHIVYSIIEKEDNVYSKYVPYINIKSDSVDQVNEDINSFVSSYVDNPNSIIVYEYNISGIFLSIVVRIEDYNDDSFDVYFRTYIINLIDKELISNDSILNYFNIDENKVSNIIESDFKNFYEDLVDEGYYDSKKCDYKCFLKYKNVSNYLDDVNYYIKDGDLVLYKPFVLYSLSGDVDYFDTDNYEFLLVESVSE